MFSSSSTRGTDIEEELAYLEVLAPPRHPTASSAVITAGYLMLSFVQVLENQGLSSLWGCQGQIYDVQGDAAEFIRRSYLLCNDTSIIPYVFSEDVEMML